MNTHEFWTDRLSDFLDGELPAREADAVREHLAECEACRLVEADLREVRGRARALGDSMPSEDLWPGIAARLGEDPLAGEVIDITRHLDSAAPIRERAKSGLFLPIPQLIAASLVLLLGGWALGATLSQDAGPAPAVAGVETDPVVRAASTLLGQDDLARRVTALEATVRARSDALSPSARAVLERNLAVIDRALAESIEALRAEPDSEYLRQHLETSLERREAALSSAVRLMDRSS